jgi:hypothetical protein
VKSQYLKFEITNFSIIIAHALKLEMSSRRNPGETKRPMSFAATDRGRVFIMSCKEQDLLNDPPGTAEPLLIIVGKDIGFNHTERRRGVNEFDFILAPDFGNKPYVCDLPLFISSGEENEISWLKVFHFYFHADLALVLGASG